MDPNDVKYQKVHNQFLDNIEENRCQNQIRKFNNLKSDKDKWNFINEARNCKKNKDRNKQFTELNRRRHN